MQTFAFPSLLKSERPNSQLISDPPKPALQAPTRLFPAQLVSNVNNNRSGHLAGRCRLMKLSSRPIDDVGARLFSKVRDLLYDGPGGRGSGLGSKALCLSFLQAS